MLPKTFSQILKDTKNTLPTTRQSSNSLSKLAPQIVRSNFPTIGTTPTVTTPTTSRVSSINYSPTAQAVTTNPVRSYQDQLRELSQKIASQVNIPTKQLQLSDVGFGDTDMQRARETIATRVGRLLDPKLSQGMEDIGEGFVSRGLFRSGLRGQEQSEFGADIAEERETQQQQLFEMQRAEAIDRLREAQQREEDRAAQARGINFSDIFRGL